MHSSQLRSRESSVRCGVPYRIPQAAAHLSKIVAARQMKDPMQVRHLNVEVGVLRGIHAFQGYQLQRKQQRLSMAYCQELAKKVSMTAVDWVS